MVGVLIHISIYYYVYVHVHVDTKPLLYVPPCPGLGRSFALLNKPLAVLNSAHATATGRGLVQYII